MPIPMRALVPTAVLLLTAAALMSGLRPGSVDARAASSEPTSLSARGLWADARGNTVLVTERVALDSFETSPAVELRFFDAAGNTAWVLPLGEGSVGALVDDDDVLYLALLRLPEHPQQESSTRLLALAMDSGSERWSLDVAGEVTDLLVDGVGGLRARSLRQQGVGAGSEHLLSLRDGRLLWDVALND
jgi:hypothetical protein